MEYTHGHWRNAFQLYISRPKVADAFAETSIGVGAGSSIDEGHLVAGVPPRFASHAGDTLGIGGYWTDQQLTGLRPDSPTSFAFLVLVERRLAGIADTRAWVGIILGSTTPQITSDWLFFPYCVFFSLAGVCVLSTPLSGDHRNQ